VIRIALFVPAVAMRIGLIQMLQDQPDMQVVAELAELSHTDAADQPVDVLLAASLPTGALQDLLQEPLPALLLLSDDAQNVRWLSHSSIAVWGALPEDASQEELLAAVRAVAEGLIVSVPSLLIPTGMTSQATTVSEFDALVEPLTARELQVLQLMARGMPNKQIALQLDISEHTVKFHLSSIYSKLGVTNRTEAVNIGVRRGLVVL